MLVLDRLEEGGCVEVIPCIRVGIRFIGWIMECRVSGLLCVG